MVVEVAGSTSLEDQNGCHTSTANEGRNRGTVGGRKAGGKEGRSEETCIKHCSVLPRPF